MMPSLFFCAWIFTFLPFVLSTNKHVVFEESKIEFRHDITMVGRPDKSIEHEVVFVVSPKNMNLLETVLFEVSSTKSPKYGQHWSREKIEDLTHNSEGKDSILGFLADNNVNVKKVSKYGNYIHAATTIENWESIFNTEFFRFYVEHLDKELIRCLSISLPPALTSHVQGVYNTVQFPLKNGSNRKRLSNVAPEAFTASSSDGIYFNYVSPALINKYYNVTNNTASFAVTQAVYESLGQQMSPSDLTYFQNYFKLPLQPMTRDIGGNANDASCTGNDCGEANLDVQYLMGVAQQANTTFWYTDDWMFGWIVSVGDCDSPSDIYSVSYGGEETGLEQSYTSSFNNEAMKLGVMGVSILVASGDTGAPGSYGNDGTKYCGYNPQFPATSPYVTTVGATMGPQSDQPEVGCQAAAGTEVLITSGGGFSTLFLRPSWQEQAVETYFSTVDGTAEQPYQGTTAIEYDNLPYEYIDYIKIPTYFNASGRGYPDVALLGHSYMVAIGGSISVEDGTSASTPVMAAFVTLANYQRVMAGAPKMGFLNPFLYEHKQAFVHDITSGNNKCTEAYDCLANGCKVHCCSEGFYAAVGWDPMTGLGSVSHQQFVAASLAAVQVNAPSLRPSAAPQSLPPIGRPPSHVPTEAPTVNPAVTVHTTNPSLMPSLGPQETPSLSPVHVPSLAPVDIPSLSPINVASLSPFSVMPVTIPPAVTTIPPVNLPTANPVSAATLSPTEVKPSRFPTVLPTAAPSTRQPTADYLGITFSVFQIMSGISVSSYQLQMANNNAVLAKTVSSFVPGTLPSNIVVTNVAAETTTTTSMAAVPAKPATQPPGQEAFGWNYWLRQQASRFLRSTDGFPVLTTTSAVNVSYTVTLPSIYAEDYNTPGAAYDTSKTVLNTAITSGQFTSQLNANAVSQGSSNLNAASATLPPVYGNYTVTSSSTQSTGSSSSGGSKRKIGPGGIAGVVIALVVVLGLVVGAVAYFVILKRGSTSQTDTPKAAGFNFDTETGRQSELATIGKAASAPVAEVAVEVENPIAKSNT